MARFVTLTEKDGKVGFQSGCGFEELQEGAKLASTGPGNYAYTVGPNGLVFSNTGRPVEVFPEGEEVSVLSG